MAKAPTLEVRLTGDVYALRSALAKFLDLSRRGLAFLNAAAQRLGAAPWASLEEVPGLMPALKRLREIKASHGLAAGPDDEPLPFDPATDARPAGPTPATTDPDSPFYEGGNPDPDSEVEP